MPTETPRRRILRPRLLVPVAVVAAAVIVVVVVASGSGGPNKTDTIQVGDSPAGVATGEGSVWVVNSGAGTLVRVDPDDKEVKGKPPTVGETPEYVAVGAGSVWVTSGLGSRVVRVNAKTGALDKTIIAGFEPVGIAVAGQTVWVADTADGTLRRIY